MLRMQQKQTLTINEFTIQAFSDSETCNLTYKCVLNKIFKWQNYKYSSKKGIYKIYLESSHLGYVSVVLVMEKKKKKPTLTLLTFNSFNYSGFRLNNFLFVFFP